MKVVVSACLMGRNCKYNGGNNRNEKMIELLSGREIIEVCPEMEAGLKAPRKSVEIVKGRVCTRDGEDLDEVFRTGAKTVLERISKEEIEFAVLQSRSPSCGVKQIYDGTFSGKLIPGQGIFAKELAAAGIPVIDVEDFTASCKVPELII